MANRSYYAVFAAMRAVLALQGFDSKKHSGIIAEFRREYIKSGLLPKELSQHVLKDIAKSLDVSVQDVTDMNMRLKSHDGSLNAIIDGDSDGTTEWLDFISDNKPNQEESLAHSETVKYRRQMFNQALYVLNKREKDILFKRRLYEKTITLDDLSKTYNISKERVRQIELNSIKKITKAIELMQ